MADMLSNTVGIMLFILAFTVLQTGGILIPKRLPMERQTTEVPVYYVCWNQRLLPLDDNLSDKLLEGLGKPSYSTASDWVEEFNQSRVEDDFFEVLPNGEAKYTRGAFQNTVQLNLVAEFKPKESAGDVIENLDRGVSLFDSRLRDLSNSDQFIYFIVYPDSIDLFRAARDYAEIRYGMGAGWGPVSADEPIRFNISGNSRGIRPQRQ